MKIKNLTFLLITLFVLSCTEELAPEDINSGVELTRIEANRSNGAGNYLDFPCDPDYEFQTIDNFTPGYHAVIVRYKDTLTEEEVTCARYHFFKSYPGLFMATLQSTAIHLDNWMVDDNGLYPSPNNVLRLNGKVEVETAICIDPRTESEECEEPGEPD